MPEDLSPLTQKKIPWTAIWSVNEISNDSSAVGTITAVTKTGATHNAPAGVADQKSSDCNCILKRTHI